MDQKEYIDKMVLVDLLGYLKIVQKEGGVFATSDLEHHKVADQLIARGWLLETTEKHMGPGSKDRCFELTDKGNEETTWIWAGDTISTT
jgi:hypothetical protein